MLKILWMIIRTSLQQLASHRANLLFEGAMNVLRVVAGLAALAAVFQETESLAGWDLSATVVVLGTYQVVSGLINAFVQPNLGFFSVRVRDGSLDDILLKPMPGIFMASMGSCSPWQFIQVVLGAGVVVTGIALSGPEVGPAQVMCYLAQVAAGIVAAWAYLVILSSVAFWDSGLELNILYSASWQLGRYPVDVYHPALTHFLTYVVPVAFISTYPARTLAKGASPGALGASLLVGVVSIGLANAVWRAGTKRYTSATS